MDIRENTSRDYTRVARAIGFLHDHAATRPDLPRVARHVGLSEFHFQRLFTRWAGVSPKRYLQYLTVEHAKARLAASRSTLDLAADAGLSGSGRLHDLFVTLEAMSPGEARAGGAGLTIRYGLHETPFGKAMVASTARGICGLHFVDDVRRALRQLREDWPRAQFLHDPTDTGMMARRIFDPLTAHRDEPLAVLVKGTNFQIQVWRALLGLRFGSVASYCGIASQIGAPAAARAVGSAVASNRIAYLIPCHRVIRESGNFSHYRWGTERKAAMLGWEAAQSGDRQ
jgi:AraC family transcriptional regulator, regulatory protein of adaptative response / methylated-DNA-[protein]-cysteine methyltransferase